MSLKESYKEYLPIADKVAEEHYNFRSKYLREDILSNARLNVFEFCHKVLPTLDSEQGVEFLQSQCYKYVYKNVHNAYRAEIKKSFEVSLNNSFKSKTSQESFGQLQDYIESNEPSAQDILERKTAKKEAKKVLSSLKRTDILVFNSVLKDTHLQEFEIAKIHGLTEAQTNQIVKTS